MTNNWADMANSTLFIAMGSNFVENHPAATAHVLRAHDLRPAAKLVVIDPRKTRTAVLAEQNGGRYIRFRPGTDIAFNNAVTKEIIRIFETADGIPTAVRDLYFNFLNHTQNQTFRRNDGVVAQPAGIQGSVYTDARFIVSGNDYQRETDSTTGTAFHQLPVKAASVTADPNTVYNKLKAHLDPYTPELAAQVCDCTADEIRWVARQYVEHSRMMSSHLTGDPITNGPQDSRDYEDYRATQMMYAMGLTQHTHGAQNVKGFAVIQTLTGNVGRAGGAINALRGIHNVQGSTDQGVLQHLIPGYSGNPGQGQSFGAYTDDLWGQATRFAGSVAPFSTDVRPNTFALAHDDAYRIKGDLALQADGFYNMTLKWFGNWAAINGMPYHIRATDAAERATNDARRAAVDAIYGLWPKSNGDDHITMFRKMALTEADPARIKGCVAWGQNPAVTEPNQSAIREGFKNLDVLVVTDLFETETAAVDRKGTGVTYLFPACSYAEKAGSVANSGRVLQWRERACAPKGNSRSDLELLFRFAWAIDKANGFSHILSAWSGVVAAPGGPAQWWDGASATPVFDELYARQHGWYPQVEELEAITGTSEMWYSVEDPVSPGYVASAPVRGTELVAESIYKQMNAIPGDGGTMWLYLDAYNGTVAHKSTNPRGRLHAGQAAWMCFNRSKNRATADPNDTFAYPGWGYSWLVNRRVLYNNGDVPGDILDGYQTPDRVARFFVPVFSGAVSYGHNNWRRVHGLSDKPDSTDAIHALAGRFPGHTEPYETPLELRVGGPALLAQFGRNTRGVAKWDLIHSGVTGSNGDYEPTYVATNDTSYPASHRKNPTAFPFVLTTIRCVEHFQGGPITRNNPWNVEIEPAPWVEINSVDANRLGIKSGDMVNVTTARGDSTTGQEAITAGADGFAEGFIARVGVGALSNQKVGPGVIAIPWHWGDRGLSTGSRANDLCIDAFDANTRIPEYKACLCNIEKINS